MSTIDFDTVKRRGKTPVTADIIRDQLIQFSKDFKTSWVNLGQNLYPVWKDKLFYTWGYEKFENYTQQELGLKKQTAMKLLKTYFFLEQEEPSYLDKDFSHNREAPKVPDYDAINVLRLARQKREINRDDYGKLKKAIFEKGKDASAVRKDLTQLMKERKVVDPDEERERRSQESLHKVITAIKTFQNDMQALKLVPADVLKETEELLKHLKAQVD